MKTKYFIPILAGALLLTGCDDQIMKWGTPDGHGEVTSAEIPLAVKEVIANYGNIKDYATKYTPNQLIGIGMGASLYVDNANGEGDLANANYQMFTPGNAMKMDAVVKKIHGQPLPGGLKGVVEPAGKKIPLEYRGKITHLTPHHALQQIGSNKYVLHARGKVAQDLQVGKSATISYMPGLSRGQEQQRGKGLQR